MDEDSIGNHLQSLRERYPDATHHCYAWVLDNAEEHYRINDDGEPGNSAGRPIYNQIRSNGLINVLVVVVRYFGGTKLGIPGLIEAYGTAAGAVISKAGIVEKEYSAKVGITGPAGEEHVVFVACNKLNIPVEVVGISTSFSLRCEVPKSKFDEFMRTAKLWHKFEVTVTE